MVIWVGILIIVRHTPWLRQESLYNQAYSMSPRPTSPDEMHPSPSENLAIPWEYKAEILHQLTQEGDLHGFLSAIQCLIYLVDPDITRDPLLSTYQHTWSKVYESITRATEHRQSFDITHYSSDGSYRLVITISLGLLGDTVKVKRYVERKRQQPVTIDPSTDR